MKMKNFNWKRLTSLSSIFLALGVVLEAIGLIAYAVKGVDEFNDALSLPVLILAISALALSLFLYASKAFFSDSSVVNPIFEVGVYSGYLLALMGFLYYIVSQVNYLANVFVAIDGTTISFPFILTAGSFLLAFVFMLLSGILGKKDADKQGEKL